MKLVLALLMLAALSACGEQPDSAVDTREQALCTPTFVPGDYVYNLAATDGHTYEYRVHIPSTYNDCVGEYPLVLMFHGGGQTAEEFEGRVAPVGANLGPFMDDMRTRAANVGAVLIWLDSGVALHYWNKGWGNVPNRDHVQVVDELVAVAQSSLSIDDDRIHAVGFSNGGMFTQHLAAVRPNTFASVASIAGASGGFSTNKFFPCPDAYDSGCTDWGPLETTFPTLPPPSSDVDVLLIRGALDNVVPDEGGYGAPFTYFLPGITNPDSIGDTDYEFWSSAAGCTPQAVANYAAGDSYQCTGSTEVRHDLVFGMSHHVPTVSNASYDGPKQIAQFLWNHPN